MARRRSDSCLDCKGPSGEDLSGGFYEAGGSFLKLGLVESFLVRRINPRAYPPPCTCPETVRKAIVSSAS